jgi:hypothetical protein
LNYLNEDPKNKYIFVKGILDAPVVQDAYQIIDKILHDGNVNDTILNTFKMFN